MKNNVTGALRAAHRGVPQGSYAVDAEALRQARQNTPSGEYHVDAEALRQARQNTPSGEYHIPQSEAALVPYDHPANDDGIITISN